MTRGMGSKRRNRLMSRLRGQRGVAMVTVMFVGASLSVVASAAAFMTIQELRSSTDDRKAATALSIAEAGVDRMIEHLRRGTLSWGQIRLAGCGTNPPITLSGTFGGSRNFTSTLTVYNPSAANPVDRIPTATNQAACAGRPLHPRFSQAFAISSTGSHPTATRVVRQEIFIKALNLPIGVYSEDLQAGGTANSISISMFVSGDVPRGRSKFEFSGTDPYYTLGDFWPALSSTTFVPAALHATGSINLNTGGGPQYEHKTSPATATINCTANGLNNGQSQFDQSGQGGAILSGPPCAGQSLARPPTSLFTATDLNRVISQKNLTEQDYLALKQSAQRTGLYCFIPTTGAASCTRQGNPWAFNPTSGNVQDGDIAPILSATKNFVAYFDYQDASKAMTSNEIKWKADVWPCDNDPNLNKSVLLIVRQGSLSLESGMEINGAILAADGAVRARGNMQVNGTIISKSFDNSGQSTFSMDACWINNMPGPFLDVTPGKWAEVDR